jgi:putative PIN family toxin of toxin-antitoxin system
MAKAVLDTNIVVSGLRNPNGIAAEVLRLAESRAFRCFASKEILNEYEEVLERASLGLKREQITKFLRMIRRTFIMVVPTKRIKAARDPDDDMFLECALEGRADYVVTGKLRHFPSRFRISGFFGPENFFPSLRQDLSKELSRIEGLRASA